MLSRIKQLFNNSPITQKSQHANKQNRQQFITIITSTITEFISITISNLAFWFIPQSNELDYSIISMIPLLEWTQILVIVVNLASLFSFIILYIIEIHREYWLISNFDYSPRYHSLHLTKYRLEYPVLFTTLETINRRYNIIYYITSKILIANLIISSSIIIHSNYGNYKTITTLFTNFWISYSKIARGLEISRESLRRGIGIAYYNTQYLYFNRIDPAKKHHISNSNLQNSNLQNSNLQNSTNIGSPIPNPSGLGSRITSRRPSIISSNDNSTPDSIINSLNNSFLGIPGSLKEIASIEETYIQCNDGVVRDIT